MCILQQSSLHTTACPLIQSCKVLRGPLRGKKNCDYFCSLLAMHSEAYKPAKTNTLPLNGTVPELGDICGGQFDRDQLSQCRLLLTVSKTSISYSNDNLLCFASLVIFSYLYQQLMRALREPVWQTDRVSQRKHLHETWYPGRDLQISSSSKTYLCLEIKQWIHGRPRFCPLVSLSAT